MHAKSQSKIQSEVDFFLALLSRVSFLPDLVQTFRDVSSSPTVMPPTCRRYCSAEIGKRLEAEEPGWAA